MANVLFLISLAYSLHDIANEFSIRFVGSNPGSASMASSGLYYQLFLQKNKIQV